MHIGSCHILWSLESNIHLEPKYFKRSIFHPNFLFMSAIWKPCLKFITKCFSDFDLYLFFHMVFLKEKLDLVTTCQPLVVCIIIILCVFQVLWLLLYVSKWLHMQQNEFLLNPLYLLKSWSWHQFDTSYFWLSFLLLLIYYLWHFSG